MSRRKPSRSSTSSSVVAVVACIALAITAWEAFGFCGGGRGVRQAVGGVWINANGILSNAEPDMVGELRQLRIKAMQEVPGDLNQPTEMRKVSLRKLEEAINEQIKAGKQVLPVEMRVLAGLQRIRYVFVYPEQNDIVLAGYGEGWKIGPKGDLVGATNGRPVLLLDDLLVALRTAKRNPQGSITCSIDPTQEGLKRLRDYVGGLRTMGDLNAITRSIEQLLGPQTITVGGVDQTSHFARVLVAADYRMKRIGMNFEESQVRGLPSYIDMLPSTSGRGMQNMTPRWWMVPNYQPMLTGDDGLAWELRGASVKTMTEDTFIGANGAKAQTGKTSSTAQQWADKMTEHYDELSVKDPIFGELRNCMDMAVVATLITREQLAAKAKHSFSLLYDASDLPADIFDTPKHTDSKVSSLKKGSNWIITASGGVEIMPWQMIDNPVKNETLVPTRHEAAAKETNKSWWWN